jgi:hypothetical protein
MLISLANLMTSRSIGFVETIQIHQEIHTSMEVAVQLFDAHSRRRHSSVVSNVLETTAPCEATLVSSMSWKVLW